MSKPESNIIPDDSLTLYLDIGHTSIKASYQEGLKWAEAVRFNTREYSKLVKWIDHHDSDFGLIIVVSVVPDVSKALVSRIRSIPVRILKYEDIPDDLLHYDTPERLGLDRFFACYGAVAHTNKSVVVIDAGTACTIDYMSENYEFNGGVITPGIGIVEKSLQKYVPNLPVVSREVPEIWPGKSTRSSLQWGIAGLYRDSLNAMIERYGREQGGFEVVLTGGDVEWIQPMLSRDSKVRPMLVFEGIKRFLEDYL